MKTTMKPTHWLTKKEKDTLQKSYEMFVYGLISWDEYVESELAIRKI